jgi:GNAT superfamily N-acetyltransferase
MSTLIQEQIRPSNKQSIKKETKSFWSELRFGVESSLRSVTRKYVNSYAFFEADLATTELRIPKDTALRPRLFIGISQTDTVCRLLSPLGKDPAELERRMLRGDLVSIGFVADEPVAYTWMTFKEGDVSELGLKVRLHTGEAVQYDTYVAPQWRGHGFQYPLNVPILNYAREHGFTKTLAWVHVLNTRSFKNQIRYGKRVVQKVISIRIPGLRNSLLIRFPGELRSRLTASETALPLLT